MASEKERPSRMTDWRATRSGTGLRIIGKNAEGQPALLTGVHYLERVQGTTFAVMNDRAADPVVLA